MSDNRDMLINLIINAKHEDPETGSFTEFLADYLIANGVICPPCKVGDTVYVIYDGYVTTSVVLAIYIDREGGMFAVSYTHLRAHET